MRNRNSKAAKQNATQAAVEALAQSPIVQAEAADHFESAEAIAAAVVAEDEAHAEAAQAEPAVVEPAAADPAAQAEPAAAECPQVSQDDKRTEAEPAAAASVEPTPEQILACVAHIHNALTDRAINKPEHATDLLKERDRFSPAIVSVLLTLGVDCTRVGDLLRSHLKSDGDRFCALYAVTKVRAIAQALAMQSISPLDPHTQTILLNVRRLGYLTAKSALVVQSRSIEYTAMDTQQNIKRYGAKYTSGTANTQRSSTREALRVLGMGPLHKGRVDDPIELFDPTACPAVARMNAVLDKALAY